MDICVLMRDIQLIRTLESRGLIVTTERGRHLMATSNGQSGNSTIVQETSNTVFDARNNTEVTAGSQNIQLVDETGFLDEAAGGGSIESGRNQEEVLVTVHNETTAGSTATVDNQQERVPQRSSAATTAVNQRSIWTPRTEVSSNFYQRQEQSSLVPSTSAAARKVPYQSQEHYLKHHGDICNNCHIILCPHCGLRHLVGKCKKTQHICGICRNIGHAENRCPTVLKHSARPYNIQRLMTNNTANIIFDGENSCSVCLTTDCYRCGHHHTVGKCYSNIYKCYKCGQTGHYKRNCVNTR